MRRAFLIILFMTALIVVAGWCFAGELAPSGENPAKTPPEKTGDEESKAAKPAGHGELVSDYEAGKIVLVGVDEGVDFMEKDRLLALTGGPEVAYMVVTKVIKAGGQGTLCTCKVEKGGELLFKGMRVVNVRIRNAELPPGETAADTTGGAGPETAEGQKPADSAQLAAAMRRIAALQREITILRNRLEALDQKYKNLDLRLVSLERSKPDTSVNLPKGLDGTATGRVIVVREDGKVAVTMGSEVGIRTGTTLYIYRPKGDGEFFFIGSINVEKTIETLSVGTFIKKNSEPMENDIVTVLPKKQAGEPK